MPSKSSGTHCLVITGASKGIGLATATRFANAGHRIVNLSRTATPVPGAIQISVDLAQPVELEAIAAPLMSAVEGADVVTLVHNASLMIPGGVRDISASQLRALFEINVVAPMILNQMLLPQMKSGSAIIYIGSTLSHRATRNMTAYVTTKHAVVGLMRSTCQDLAGTGVHTCCICPGFTETEMVLSYGEQALKNLAGLSTQNRLSSPSEIADFVHFAAGQPVLNGAVLNADLGFIEP